MENYYNALVEVDTILDYMVEEDYKKVPEEVIRAIKENKSEDYVFNYDEELELQDQILLEETKEILFNFFRDYWSTQEQKEKILEWQRESRAQNEMRKINNYKYTEIFSSNDKENNEQLCVQLQEVKDKENIFRKIINWLKNIIKK